MIKKTLVVNEEHGLHARPSAKISKVCRDLDSKVTFSKNAKTADGKSILQMLLLAAEQGAIIEVVVEGGDLREVARFVSEKLSTLEGVISTATHFRLKTYKENGFLFARETHPERLSVSP